MPILGEPGVAAAIAFTLALAMTATFYALLLARRVERRRKDYALAMGAGAGSADLIAETLGRLSWLVERRPFALSSPIFSTGMFGAAMASAVLFSWLVIFAAHAWSPGSVILLDIPLRLATQDDWRPAAALAVAAAMVFGNTMLFQSPIFAGKRLSGWFSSAVRWSIAVMVPVLVLVIFLGVNAPAFLALTLIIVAYHAGFAFDGAFVAIALVFGALGTAFGGYLGGNAAILSLAAAIVCHLAAGAVALIVRRPALVYSIVFAIALVGAGCVLAMTPVDALTPEKFARVRSTVFFLGVLGAAGGVFDVLAIAATRFSLASMIGKSAVKRALLAIGDILLGLVLSVAKAICVLFLADRLILTPAEPSSVVGASLLDAGALLDSIAANPGAYWWLLAAFLTPMLWRCLHFYHGARFVVGWATREGAPVGMAAARDTTLVFVGMACCVVMLWALFDAVPVNGWVAVVRYGLLR